MSTTSSETRSFAANFCIHLLGGLKFRGLLALASRETSSCHCHATDVILFWCVVPKLCSKEDCRFRLSSGLGYEVVKHVGNMFESYRVIVRKQSASGFDQQLQRVNTYANIKNMTSFPEHSKSSFVAKCLSSLHSMCKLDGLYTLGHFWRGRSFQEVALVISCYHVTESCDCLFLVRFSFLIPKTKFSHHLGWGKVWPNVANGTLTKIIYQLSTIKGVDMKKH